MKFFVSIEQNLYKFFLSVIMVKTCESWLAPSPNLDRITVSFDNLNNTETIRYKHKHKSRGKFHKAFL